MDLYYYNLNTKYINLWNLCKILSYRKFIELNTSCNDIRINVNASVISNGGWHLSYFGDATFIKNKIQNFSHQELNNDNFTDLAKIETRVKNFADLYDRGVSDFIKINIKDNNNLPFEYHKYLIDYYND